MTPDRWGYKVDGFPEFGTEFHLVGTYLEALVAVNSITDRVAMVVHEDEFL